MSGAAGQRERRRRLAPYVVVLAGLVIALFPTAAQAGTQAGTDCVAGAPGAGDPYYPTAGNGGYDVRHYDLNLRYRPATDRLDGRASIRAMTERSLCRFNLDLVGLDVLAVRVNGKPAASSRSGQELMVTPREPLAKRAQFEVAVRYAGVPVEILDPKFSIPIGFTPTSDGVIVAGEPAGAAAWFPVNDHPSDEAAYSFNVTVPAGYEVVANGKPHGRATSLGRSTEWRWEAREPMPSYLVTIDVGYWDVTRWRTEAGVPVYDAVDSTITGAVREQIDSSLARQGEILDTLSAAFGPYPFDTVGAIVDPERPLGFALETQTRPVYWSAFWLDDLGNPISADYVVVHELAHQWFGDDVALERWQDIWLSEGFATYAEWLWLEHEGAAGVRQAFDATYAGYPAEDPLWSVVVGDPGPEHQLDDAVYYRGAMTLQALREEIGDEAFWKLIRRWAKRKGGGHGSTGQFIATAERVSGRRLDSLFETWLFTPQKPPPLVAQRPGREQTIEGGDQDALTWLAGMQNRLRIGRY